MSAFDWNDLQYLLAVARHGSTTAASRALHVKLLPLAEQVEQAVGAFSHSPLLERFGARYPGLQLEFVMRDQYLDFAQGAGRCGPSSPVSLLDPDFGEAASTLFAGDQVAGSTSVAFKLTPPAWSSHSLSPATNFQHAKAARKRWQFRFGGVSGNLRTAGYGKATCMPVSR